MSGKLVVLEGLDGSGKATQAALLTKALARQGARVRQVSFPNYESPSSAPVRMYLAGEFGADPGDVNAYAASSFYAVDRYAGFKKDWGGFYAGGGVIVADRYVTSNAIHQCAKLPRAEWDGYLRWLFSYEHDLLGLPRPDAVVYLRTESAVSDALLSGRYGGDESRRDIHERSGDYMAAARQAAEYCRAALGWRTVECVRNGEMRPPEAIHTDILAALEDLKLL